MSQNSSDNKVGSSTNTDALSIEKSASGQFINFDDQTNVFGLYNNAGLPEGVVTANPGSLCSDNTGGVLNMKNGLTGNTGWEQLPYMTTVSSWTPTVSGNGSAGVGTYTTQTGANWFFAVVGVVFYFVSAVIVWTAHTGSGGMRVSLPFFDGGSPRDISGGVLTDNIAWPAGVTQLYIVPVGSGQADINGIGSSIAPTIVQLPNAGTLQYTLFYRSA